MVLPEQPRLSEMARYIKDLAPANLVYFARIFRKRRRGSIYIGICPTVNDRIFKDTLKFNLEYRGWKIIFSKNGESGVALKEECQFKMYFYSTKFYKLIKKPDKIEAIPV